MYQLAERKIDQQGHHPNGMDAKKPVDFRRLIFKMEQPVDEGLDIDEVGSEKEMEQDPAQGDGEKQK